MRSLYQRVFLAFWGTIAVIIVGQHLFHLFYASETGIPELLVSLVVSLFPCYLLARYFTRRIVRLRAFTRQIAGGDLTSRIGADLRKGKDEISALVGDFDHMVSQIESSMRAQKMLIADISHELRSPLTRLRVALELALSGTGTAQFHALERVELESIRLNELIGSLLVLSHLESGEKVVERSLIDLGELLRSVILDAEFEASNRHRAIRADLEPLTFCCTMGNSDLLRSAIENVVRNAIRYTAENTEVIVSAHLQEIDDILWAVIQVKDRGPGVPEEEMSSLFRPFYRVEKSRDRIIGGAGLGLAITQRAVQFHSGTVAARNSPEGGLIVQINIPAQQKME